MICVLCGKDVAGKDFSREHVFPQWIRDLFPDMTERVDYRRALHVRGQTPEPEPWKDRAFNLRVKDLCRPCNNEWCNEIETEARPFLTPMILGQNVTLDASAQASLAVWATKTLLMLQMTHPGDLRSISDEEFRWFRQHRWPLPHEQIWIGAYDGTGDWPTTYHHYAIGLFDATISDPPEDVNGHAALFSIGQLVFRTFGNSVDITARPRGAIAGAMRQIWPVTGEVIDFPPPVRASGSDGLRALIDALSTKPPPKF